MLTIDTYTANASISDQLEFSYVIRDLLSKGYKPLLQLLENNVHSILGTSPGILKYIEVFRPSDDANFRSYYRREHTEMLIDGHRIFIIRNNGSKLHVIQLRRHDYPSYAKGFLQQLEAIMRKRVDGRRLRRMSFDWERIDSNQLSKPKNEKDIFSNLKFRKPEFSDVELNGSKVLGGLSSREFLQSLSRIHKGRPADVSLKAITNDESILIDAKIICTEYLIQCKKDNRTLGTSATKEEITSHLKCGACRRSYIDELISEVYSLTDLGLSLNTKSHWMTIYVTSILNDIGIQNDDILWGATGSQDEIDLCVNVAGKRVFFELKDRDFGLGDMYAFAGRIDRYNANLGVIITTHKIADDVKSFIQEGSKKEYFPRILQIEGLNPLKSKLSKELISSANDSILGLISPQFNDYSLDFGKILKLWANRILSNACTVKQEVAVSKEFVDKSAAGPEST